MNQQRRSLLSRRKVTVPLGLAILAIAASAAFAYWSGSGSGSGEATVGTSGTLTVTATVGEGLAPGTEVPVSFKAANSGGSSLMLAKVKFVKAEVDAGHSACSMSDFSMAEVTEGVQITAGATAQSLPTEGKLKFANSEVDQDACQGATLNLVLTTS